MRYSIKLTHQELGPPAAASDRRHRSAPKVVTAVDGTQFVEETHPDLMDPPIDATAPKSASTGAVRESIKCKASSSIRPPGEKLLKDVFVGISV